MRSKLCSFVAQVWLHNGVHIPVCFLDSLKVGTSPKLQEKIIIDELKS